MYLLSDYAGRAGLAAEDLPLLTPLLQELDTVAALTGCDVFIDCPIPGGAIVIAQAEPSGRSSLYRQDITGQLVSVDKEPAVFHTLRFGTVMRDIKATTQENRTVRQDAVPIRGSGGQIIGVLIREKDISGELSMQKKYRALAQQREASSGCAAPSGVDAYERAVHHWVKNDLNLAAGLLRLELRQCEQAESRAVLEAALSKLLSIVSVHDILSRGRAGESVSCLSLLHALADNARQLLSESQHISITLCGDDIPLSPEQMPAVAIVTSELVTNAIRHAFLGGRRGHISVSYMAGLRYSFIMVEDDGAGYDPHTASDGNGIVICSSTVEEKLHGTMQFRTGPAGTCAVFSMLTPAHETE